MTSSIRTLALTSLAILACSCAAGRKTAENNSAKDFPTINQKGKIAIVAHRGFWKCEAAANSQNSIASLREAQDNGFWGSEFDVQLTSDDVVIVNHDNTIMGKKIWDTPFEDFKSFRLPNGEGVSTLDEYLTQGEKCKTTILVLEFKAQKNAEREDVMIQKSVELLKAHKLFTPKRVAFISFSKHVCEVIAEKYPQFINQYLTGRVAPGELAEGGINGIDYHYSNFYLFPKWVEEAHQSGMSVNAWTVDKEADMQKMINLGVDAITTNYPLVTRGLLSEKEFKLVK